MRLLWQLQGKSGCVEDDGQGCMGSVSPGARAHLHACSHLHPPLADFGVLQQPSWSGNRR